MLARAYRGGASSDVSTNIRGGGGYTAANPARFQKLWQ
jgi:hypothetical protein